MLIFMVIFKEIIQFFKLIVKSIIYFKNLINSSEGIKFLNITGISILLVIFIIRIVLFSIYSYEVEQILIEHEQKKAALQNQIPLISKKIEEHELKQTNSYYWWTINQIYDSCRYLYSFIWPLPSSTNVPVIPGSEGAKIAKDFESSFKPESQAVKVEFTDVILKHFVMFFCELSDQLILIADYNLIGML